MARPSGSTTRACALSPPTSPAAPGCAATRSSSTGSSAPTSASAPGTGAAWPCSPWCSRRRSRRSAPGRSSRCCSPSAASAWWTRASRRFRRPEVAIVVALAVAQAMIATAIVINDRQHLGDLALLMWPVVGLSAAYPGRVVAAGTAYSSALMIAASLGFDGSVVLHDPSTLCVPLGMLLAVSDAHQRAARERGRAARCRGRRRADRHAQPHGAGRPLAGARAPVHGHRAPRRRSSATSTTSRRSTTPTGTRPATSS